MLFAITGLNDLLITNYLINRLTGGTKLYVKKSKQEIFYSYYVAIDYNYSFDAVFSYCSL